MSTQIVQHPGDQAQALRGLMRRLQADRFERSNSTTPCARSIAVTSGKGGVGKTSLALNLAIALAQLDSRTSLLDANLGLGNLDLLCGLNGYWNLSHVVTGARNLADIVLEGPAGIRVIPGASGLTELADWPESVQSDVICQLGEFEESQDFLVIDTAAGIHRSVRQFLEACDLVLVVATPEPTAIADAYATIKSLSGGKSLSGDNGSALMPTIEVVINQADSAEQAQLVAERIRETAKSFLRCRVQSAGWIPRDPEVAAAVTHRHPFLLQSPASPASVAVGRLAQRLKQFFTAQPPRGSLFPRVQSRCGRQAA